MRRHQRSLRSLLRYFFFFATCYRLDGLSSFMGLFLLMKVIPDKAEAYRLLGEVKFELKDYEGSSSSYKSALSVSKSV